MSIPNQHPIVWNMQFHRTIQSNHGTLSHDVYTLRRHDLNLPYYTVSVPHKEDQLMHNLFEALNHRMVYETPPKFAEIDAILYGPWHVNPTTKTRYIHVTDSEERILRAAIFSHAARSSTLQHELDVMKIAFEKLEKVYNLQDKVIQSLRAKVTKTNGSDLVDEEILEKPELPDLFRTDNFDRTIPQFEFSKEMHQLKRGK